MNSTNIADNIKRVKERIANAAISCGRNPDEITLIGVTKNFGVDEINDALNNGIEVIGENRVQEMLDKYPFVSPRQWHLIGHLQTNKVKYIVGRTALIHSVDSEKLMREIDLQSKKAGVISDVLLQVNTSGEDTKFGLTPQQTHILAQKASEYTNVCVKGIMTIAPIYLENVSATLHFHNTRKLFIDIKDKKYDNVDMSILSMGMSGDFEDAIRQGSTMVRVGSAIFGKRIY